ncbi:MAG: hypothetical protein KA758_02750 [Acidimicrobiales bacterium]|jgi:hypothetical protein|nr:hypothetical protein [Acidimicrobiales bacterium]
MPDDDCTTCLAVVDRVDVHLAAIPPGRSLVDINEHVDMLLDIRNLAAGAMEACVAS